MKHGKIWSGIVLFLLVIASANVFGQNNDLLSIENKFIKIFINQSSEDTGRFAVDVTEGDVERKDDDNKALIYGRPKPWTSYTTVRVNGNNYVFGKTTTKRAGAGLAQGEIVEAPHLEDGRIIMKCSYGSVLVEQALDIVTSPTTGAKDTARIKYTIINQGDEPAAVGLRTVLDTMLGNNDGAPFRVGEQEITYDFAMKAEDYPDFWQAFDSFEQPSVIAQGTLRGGDVTPPDRFAITNWGNAADHSWELPIQPGREFVRAGEAELDSAVVMFWLPRQLEAGGTYSVVIYYGLGGITFAPGNTFLGISAPAQVEYGGEKSRSYTVVTYMSHQGEANAKDVHVYLDLPLGLELVKGKLDNVIEELAPGVTRQFSWQIRATGKYFGDTSFRLRVVGDGLESNEVTRKINIKQPLVIQATMNVPKLKLEQNRWNPDPLTVKVNVKNLDERIADDVVLKFMPLEGFELAQGEVAERPLVDLPPGQQETVSWKVRPVRGFKTGEFKVRLEGPNIALMDIPGKIAIPRLPFVLEFNQPQQLQQGQVFSVDLVAYNLYDAARFELDVKYDPSLLRLVYVSRGTMLVEEEVLSPWYNGVIDSNKGLLKDVQGSRSTVFSGQKSTLCRLDFVALAEGEGILELPKIKVFDLEGKELPNEFSPVKYKIEVK